MGVERGSWNWAISLLPSRCAPPSLLLLSRLRTKRRPTRLPLHKAMGQQKWPCLGKWAATRGETRALQPDGTLRCPAGQSLVANARRTEADGSLRVVYAASIRSCRPCPLREQCQWHGRAATKPRRVSVLLHPLLIGSAPLLVARTGAGGLIDARACNSCATNASKCRSNRPARPARMPHLRPFPVRSGRDARLSWQERLARNARPLTAGQVTIRLFGGTFGFATSLGLATV
jgi:hypothetical protein